MLLLLLFLFLLVFLHDFSVDVAVVFATAPASNISVPTSRSSSKFYRGGFDPVMGRREAALVLGVPPSKAAESRRAVQEAHR